MAKKKKTRKTVRKRKPRKRRRLRLEGVLSLFVSALLIAGGVGGGIYAWHVLSREDTEEIQEEEEVVPVYADLYRINQDIQIENLRNAEPGDIVDAQGLSDAQLKMFFTATNLSDDQLDKMSNVTIFEDELPVDTEDLLYLRVLHKDFSGNDVIGELIVNQNIARNVLSLFYDLYQMDYPIEQIRLLDSYSGNLKLSHTDNNTSAFSQRNMEGELDRSARARGYVIDLNPFYNPEIDEEGNIVPESSLIYVDRVLEQYSNPQTRKKILEQNHMLTLGDDVVDLFESYGFIWQGDSDTPEYEMFLHKSAPKSSGSQSTKSETKTIEKDSGSAVNSKQDSEDEEDQGEEESQEMDE